MTSVSAYRLAAGPRWPYAAAVVAASLRADLILSGAIRSVPGPSAAHGIMWAIMAAAALPAAIRPDHWSRSIAAAVWVVGCTTWAAAALLIGSGQATATAATYQLLAVVIAFSWPRR